MPYDLQRLSFRSEKSRSMRSGTYIGTHLCAYICAVVGADLTKVITHLPTFEQMWVQIYLYCWVPTYVQIWLLTYVHDWVPTHTCTKTLQNGSYCYSSIKLCCLMFLSGYLHECTCGYSHIYI